jgi:FkbM family methyltransferase
MKEWLYGKCPGLRGAFPYYGVKVYFPINSLIFHLACEQGVYEHENIKMILSLIKPETFYFDVGANIGLMSIPILRTKSDCKVVSFEPSPNSLPYLIKTHERSSFRERWAIIGKGAANHIGDQRFFASSMEMGAFDSLAHTGTISGKREIVIPVTTIDAEWEALGRPSVSAIKIDVEGAELQALQGALKCVAQEQPSLLIEWNSHHLQALSVMPTDLLSFVKNISYAVFSMPHLIPCNSPNVLQAQMLKTESFLLLPLQ